MSTAATVRTQVSSVPSAAAPGAQVLPAWPLLAWLYGFPVYWATGLSLFVPIVFGSLMAAFLLLRGRLRATPGVLVWGAFLAWVVVCAVSLTGVMQAIGFFQRTIDLFAVGIAFLYYVNARERITPGRVFGGLAVIWLTVVVLGTLAVFFPDVRIATPLAQVLPGSLMGNELVRELVYPRLAEVQQPWGAEEPFVRPAAPFPYTNSWGMAYALLTPVMALIWTRLRRRGLRVLLAAALLGSLYPAAQTSNRGMFIALGVFLVFMCFRFFAGGMARAGFAMLGSLAAGIAILAGFGVFAAIAGRQEYSDTTTGRSTIYQATIERVLESPLVGWATPAMDASIGISLGTQGYAWTLMFCYGFVGLLLFLVFLIRIITVSWKVRSGAAYVMQGLIVTVGVTIWFYGLAVTQCLILLLAAAILSRASADGEKVFPRV
ncbi:O-antigen ligase domain-containing protein [Microbacterium sp. 179-I 3D4 NHS]|uniref:O-antigen ligase domain-containing protein n=1 Tax=Microbacterium sp. 179-I 3D4 NHS TaxID=3142381 RepID=UPI00399F963C